jgi:hypothetical protein
MTIRNNSVPGSSNLCTQLLCPCCASSYGDASAARPTGKHRPLKDEDSVYGGQGDYALDEMGGNDSERMNMTMSDDDRYAYE